jgi:deoxyadenosine/deoxycytidine kinase
LIDHPTSVLQDRTVYEDAEVFAHNLFMRDLMSERDHQTYRELYEVLTSFLPAPDLIVYLRASVPTLLRRIAQRGRDYERSIQPDYLEQLNELYEDWIDRFSLCPALAVPADDLNYATNDEHLDLITQKIREKLAGKEEVIFAPEEVARLNGLR